MCYRPANDALVPVRRAADVIAVSPAATSVTVTTLSAVHRLQPAPGCDLNRAIDAAPAHPITQSSPPGAQSGRAGSLRPAGSQQPTRPAPLPAGVPAVVPVAGHMTGSGPVPRIGLLAGGGLIARGGRE